MTKKVLWNDWEFCERARANRAVFFSIRRRAFLATARAPFLPIASAPHEEHLHVVRSSAPLLQGARAAIPVTLFSFLVDTTASPLCHLTRFFRVPFLPLHPTLPSFLFIIPSPAPHLPPHGPLASEMVSRRGSSAPATSQPAAPRGGTRRASPGAGRVKNFSHGESLGVMTPASAHWAEFRGRRTGDKKRRMETGLIKAFVEATPAADQEAARTRSIESVDQNIKIMHGRYNKACKDLKVTGLSSSERDDILLKFGGCVLFSLARTAFKGCPISPQTSVRDPIKFGASLGEADSAVGTNEGVEDAGAAAGGGGGGGERCGGADLLAASGAR